MATSKLMRAIRVSEFGPPSVLKLCTDLPVPSPGQKQVGHLKKYLKFLIYRMFKF